VKEMKINKKIIGLGLLWLAFSSCLPCIRNCGECPSLIYLRVDSFEQNAYSVVTSMKASPVAQTDSDVMKNQTKKLYLENSQSIGLYWESPEIQASDLPVGSIIAVYKGPKSWSRFPGEWRGICKEGIDVKYEKEGW
jgi:hypothetical protein